jgi:hypothetical protein
MSKSLFPLIKKSYAQKAQRFEATIRQHQTRNEALPNDPTVVNGAALQDHEFELVERILRECRQDSQFQRLKEYYQPAESGARKISDEQLLVRMLAQRFKDPFLVLERNARRLNYDEEAWSEDEAQERAERSKLAEKLGLGAHADEPEVYIQYNLRDAEAERDDEECQWPRHQ